MYKVILNNNIVKSYPYKIQAIVWCFLNGYVYSGGYDFDNKRYYFLDDSIKIERVKNYV